jgi:anaerobic selenocysteine-containing dehydrogenase
MAIRHVTNFSPAALEPAAGALQEWQILSRLSLIAQGRPTETIESFDESMAEGLARVSVKSAECTAAGVTAEEALAAVAPRTGAERLVDIQLRSGPYGDLFGHRPGGISLNFLELHPHGIDAGPLEPRIPEVLRTPSGKIELAPQPILDTLMAVESALAQPPAETLLLIGRRDIRSNNSWMHNIPNLLSAQDRCTLLMHPEDAARLGCVDGELASVRSRVGIVDARVEVTEDIRPGVVSLPHGWGHVGPEIRLQAAGRNPGVNVNILTDPDDLDEMSGNVVLNAVPVEVRPVAST